MSTISTIVPKSVKLTKWTIGLALSAALVGCGGGGEAPTPVPIVSSNLSVPLSAATVGAIATEGAFTFATGFSANAGAAVLAGPTTVALPTATTFTITNGGGVATGSTAFGSCIFTVTASSVPGLAVNTVLTVNPCTLNVATSGDGIGLPFNDLATLVFGTSTSASVTVQATTSSTGVVTVNGVVVGTVTITDTTGASGSNG